MSIVDDYELIRQKLNVKGQGAPKHDKVIEFLKIIWTKDDLKVLLHFEGVGKMSSAAKIAKKSGIEKSKVKEVLTKLADKGTILKVGSQYGLLPFVPGIFELYFVTQKDSKDNFKKASVLMERIIDEVLPGMSLAGKFQIFRPKLPYDANEKIIQINESVETRSQALPWELVEEMINSSDYYAKIPCQCRLVGEYIGDPCKVAPPDIGCFITGFLAKQLVETMNVGERLTKEEAIDYLKRAEKAGLVHNGANLSSNATNLLICNCCSCHCGALKPQSKHKFGAINKSNYVPILDENLCVKCGTCIKKCPMDAIFHIWPTEKDSSDEKIVIKSDFCIGCGVCAVNCPKNAIKMEKVHDEIAPKSLGIGLEGMLGM
ncbi:MAG: 4Fe-4S dicluster domain-containing protein [Candidatus Helarchaeota archaeon]